MKGNKPITIQLNYQNKIYDTFPNLLNIILFKIHSTDSECSSRTEIPIIMMGKYLEKIRIVSNLMLYPFIGHCNSPMSNGGIGAQEICQLIMLISVSATWDK